MRAVTTAGSRSGRHLSPTLLHGTDPTAPLPSARIVRSLFPWRVCLEATRTFPSTDTQVEDAVCLAACWKAARKDPESVPNQ